MPARQPDPGLGELVAGSDREQCLQGRRPQAGSAPIWAVSSVHALWHIDHPRGQTVGAGFEAVNTITEPLLAAGIGFVREG
jgi:hypothetical protein